jgi:hypothetical protein
LSVVTVSDDADAPWLSVLPPDSSVDASEDVVDVVPIDDELEPEDEDVDDGSDAEEDDVGLDSDAVELFELEEVDGEDSSAHATAGVVATAPLTPSATANAPTRPMCVAYPVIAVRLEFAERELNEFADEAGPATVPSRVVGSGAASSTNADKCLPAVCFPYGVQGFVDVMTTPRFGRERVRYLLSHQD